MTVLGSRLFSLLSMEMTSAAALKAYSEGQLVVMFFHVTLLQLKLSHAVFHSATSGGQPAGNTSLAVWPAVGAGIVVRLIDLEIVLKLISGPCVSFAKIHETRPASGTRSVASNDITCIPCGAALKIVSRRVLSSAVKPVKSQGYSPATAGSGGLFKITLVKILSPALHDIVRSISLYSFT